MSSPVRLRPCTGPDEWPVLLRVWRSAVTATHDFLAPGDIEHYEQRIRADYLPALAAGLTVAVVGGRVVGFSAVADGTLEMLFVAADHRGHGAGSALLLAALGQHPDLRVDVNEQNPDALGFYRHHGFQVVGRSPLDGDGRPYPLLHLARPAGDDAPTDPGAPVR